MEDFLLHLKKLWRQKLRETESEKEREREIDRPRSLKTNMVSISLCPAQPLLLSQSSFTGFNLIFRGKSSVVTLNAPRRTFLPPRSKMFVPGFSQSPESKAATTLHNYFTYLAVQIVLAQLEEYNPEAYKDLKAFAERTPLKDGDQFCATLLRESPRLKGLAMRILEVRSTYASEEFEWDNMRKLAIKYSEESNTSLMRQYLRETSNME